MKCLKRVLDIPYLKNGVVYVTDWKGKVHAFKSIGKANHFYRRLVSEGPRPEPYNPARWQRMPPQITFHAQRHKFSHGRAHPDP